MNSLGRFAKFPAVNAEKYAMTRVVLGVAWLGMRRGMAGQGKAQMGTAWQVKARNKAVQGGARQVRVGCGSARRGRVRQGSARQGSEQGKAGLGKARLGGARLGRSRHGDLGASVNHPFDTRQTSEPKNRCKHERTER